MATSTKHSFKKKLFFVLITEQLLLMLFLVIDFSPKIMFNKLLKYIIDKLIENRTHR